MPPESLRDEIMNMLYKEAPDSPWLSDVFWDKLLTIIEIEKKKAVKEALSDLLNHDEACDPEWTRGWIREVLSNMFPFVPSPPTEGVADSKS